MRDAAAKRRARAAMKALGLPWEGIPFDPIPGHYHRVRMAQRDRCYLCADRFEKRTGHKATKDHVLPRARGGLTLGNVLWAGAACNELKADRWPMPCELIYLAAVNARLGIPTAAPWVSDRRRMKAA